MTFTKKITSPLLLALVAFLVTLAGLNLAVTTHALTAYSNPYTCPTQPVLQLDSTGTCVKYVQYTLHLTPSGTYDSATVTRVKLFQFNTKVANVGCGTSYTTCNGIVGAATWIKVNSYNASQTQAALAINTYAPVGTVTYAKCATTLTGTESDADRTTDGARVLIVAGGVTYTVTSTTKTWSWTIPSVIKNNNTYSIAVSGRNVNAGGAYAGTNTVLSGSPVSYNYSVCVPVPTPTPVPPTNTTVPPDTGDTTVTTDPNSPSLDASNNTTSGASGTDNTGPTAGAADTGSESLALTSGSGASADASSRGRSSLKSPKAISPKSSLVKTVAVSFIGIIVLLALAGAGLFWYARRRLEPSYDDDVYATSLALPSAPTEPVVSTMPLTPVTFAPEVPASQPPAGPESTYAQTFAPPPSPYAAPATDNAITRKINEAFYPNQKTPVAASIAATKVIEADDVPDMYEIANQNPGSYGNAHYVQPDLVKPPEPKV